METNNPKNQNVGIVPELTKEQTIDLMSKASKVSSWMSAIKKKSECIPFTGSSKDNAVVVTIRNQRLESVSVHTNRDIVDTMPSKELLALVFEAHADALDNMDAWVTAQLETISESLGVGDFQMPF